ncbi:MAG: glycosyltransferase family 2 protein [Algibacter sp.]|uniref:glycosyltransferase family 2 protein n=1 Tax=Algibacter sp. TaxID=1872428 RepID=UPI0032999885
MSILVSVIIPTYNRGHLILDTLKSVQKQSHLDFECFIVDDHSTDNTQDVVTQFCLKNSKFHYLKRPGNRLKGANACRNFGLQNSNGMYVNWLDSDDLMAVNHLEEHLAIHHKDEHIIASVSIAGTFKKIMGDREENWSAIFSKNDLIEDMLTSKVSWQTAAVLWKKEALPIRPFREELSSSQEWTFHLSQVIDGLRFDSFNSKTIYVRRHQDRIGNEVSEKKFKSSFTSRYIIFNLLWKKNRLSKPYQKALLNKMFQAIKKAIYYKFDNLVFKQILGLLSVFFKTSFKWKLIKIIFFYIPIYRLTNRGETLFKI